MRRRPRFGLRETGIWVALIAAMTIPLLAALNSPLLQWRDPIYIAAGIAGIAGMALLLVQPLLVAGLLPRLTRGRARSLHRLFGAALIGAVIVHVAALWITSPPDVVDALLLRSPTSFSIWGVAAMWAVFTSGLLALLRQRLPLRLWRLFHTALFMMIVAGTLIHALKIDGTMEQLSKIALSLAIIVATLAALAKLRVWKTLKR